MSGLEAAGFKDASVLEVGSGTGFFHRQLLKKGASEVVGVDLAQRMVDEATAGAKAEGLEGRVRYLVGDFVALSDEIENVDVTVLDKVVCCYPDAEALLGRSLAKTRRVYALTYPRDRALARLGMGFTNAMMWVLRSCFRGYVHDPRQIRRWVEEAGFVLQSEELTTLSRSEVYVRGT